MRVFRGDIYQSVLIVSGIVVTALFGVFLYRELFPEYKIYQDDYIALEEFRSTYTGNPVPPFTTGVKQIVMEKENKGPADIDRCISCHVALQFEHFSPTKLVDGKTVPNPDYVFLKLDQKIEDLQKQGNAGEAKKLEGLKTAHVGDHVYDVTKVLKQHPLIGKETRPFEFHPLEEYGCVVCHNGNGRGLTTETAHGPIFDGEYQTEFMGPKREFLEKDPKNDPLFSRVFNNKPGHELLFMTTPLFVGGLIEAKCVQCHKPNDSESPVHPLITNYTQGEALFVAEGCYACHRIGGVSRAGVGPELTKEGLKYPWFIKESIVWPQADLKTSTMPNMRLDHKEVEALMTFLLAQTGKRKSDSETGYKVAIQDWEIGKRLNFWETKVSPSKLNDLKFAMTVFATEGCAACHRLKGFESNVGFTSDSDHEWFKNLFPEEIIGSQIALVARENAKEIDERIVNNVRTGSLLEEIEKEHPGIIESFYSNFRFAARASQDKERIHRILMMYIQEYGLGRLIGPRPNWSGVYRSDEWLMEHFRNPSAHVARSIMPVFPFDDTKFYALTKMLDALGRRNSEHLKEIWGQFGFNPEIAYTMLCAQCHGEYRQGNGPVSEWIYPIPKNLRNANFLRNLTKERAFDSIKHGVKGTPMPPWGEVGEGKQGEPVLTPEEIHKLVDWLYSSIPGIKGQDPPKWHYTPEDALEDIRKQDLEELLKTEARIDLKRDILYASVVKVDQIFDITPRPAGYVDKNSYMIKKSFYTKENLAEGMRIFDLNCAVCHGKDADGRGLRAGAMVDAKPRMLTNLNWLGTRDDLRLLRSIKFGVPGTSMTPWGDVTSGLQRIQLVMYIRSLSKEGILRETLSEALYKNYDTKIQMLEQSRIETVTALEKANLKKKELESQEDALKTPSASVEEIAKVIAAEIKEQSNIDMLSQLDQKVVSAITELQKQKHEYQNIGNSIITMLGDSDAFDAYIAFLEGKEDGSHLVKTLQSNANTLKEEARQTPENAERVNELTLRSAQIEKLAQKLLNQIGNPAILDP